MEAKFCSWIVLILHTHSLCMTNHHLVIHPKFHQPVHSFPDGGKIPSYILSTSRITNRCNKLLSLDYTTWDLNVIMLLCYSLSWKTTYLWLHKAGTLVTWVFFQAHYQDILLEKCKKPELVGIERSLGKQNCLFFTTEQYFKRTHWKQPEQTQRRLLHMCHKGWAREKSWLCN